MELESSYNLLDIVRDDGIRTYRAIEKASGQELQVHLFAKPESESDRALFKALRALPVSKRRELLEIGVEGDMPYIVTDKLPDNSTAREWLTKLSGIVVKPAGPAFLSGSWKTGTPIPEEVLRASHASAPPVLPTPKREIELSPDYTRVMRVPQGLSAEPPAVNPIKAETAPPKMAAPPPPPPVEPVRKPQPTLTPDPPPVVVQPPAEEPDEFTRMFGISPTPPVTPAITPAPPLVKPPVQPSVTAPVTPPVVPPPVTPVQEPGEFTRMFLASMPTPPPPTVVPPPVVTPVATTPEPGEFTRQFQTTRPPEPAKPVQPASQFLDPRQAATPPPPQSTAAPGEFTSMFLAAQPPQAVPPVIAPPLTPVQTPPPPSLLRPTPPPPSEPSPEAATRLFQAVTPSTSPTSSKPPGEFTQMFPTVAPSGSPLPTPVSGSVPGALSGGAPPPPKKDGPSEFTRFFQSPISPTPMGNQKLPSSTPMSMPQPTNRQSSQPSEFTQMFGNPNKPGSAAPPPPLGAGNSGASSSATGLFSTPKSSPPRGTMKSTPASSGPGEFTRMMAMSSAPTLGQPTAQTAAPEPKAKSNLMLYIAGGCVLLAIILLIVFFAMR